jgi:hypothetical protein
MSLVFGLRRVVHSEANFGPNLADNQGYDSIVERLPCAQARVFGGGVLAPIDGHSCIMSAEYAGHDFSVS